MSSGREYAVAIRDTDLFLWYRIRRSLKGEVFVMIATGRSRGENGEWDPHSSWHVDGTVHEKSHNHKMIVRKKQKPDANFLGTECFTTRPIAVREPRAFGVLCNPADFDEVFEIAVNGLSTQTYRTAVSIDLSQPSGLPIKPPGALQEARIIQQYVFRDAVPWIVATLYENPE